MSQVPLSPSPNLLRLLSLQLMRHPPFSAMDGWHVQQLLSAASERYFAPGETVLSPADGVIDQVFLVRQGEVIGHRSGSGFDVDATGDAETARSAGALHFEAGDMFPVAAALARRAVSTTYRCASDLFCLVLPVQALEAVARQSPPLAGFLAGKTLLLLEMSRRAAQASMALQEQSLDRELRSMLRGPPTTCAPGTKLLAVLQTMSARRIGSMLVVDAQGALLGIFTRRDVLDKVALARRSLDDPVGEVMTQPVHALDVAQRVDEAALLMARHGVTHVPLLDGGQVVGIVSERDLFAMHRLSLRQVGANIRHAQGVAALQEAADAIRGLARSLLGQGMMAKPLTALISHLNDMLAERLVQILAAEQSLDLDQACWLSFGSEGRSEQTIATDQDNGLAFASSDPDQDRSKWLAFGDAMCHALDACGYPLCKGGIMANNPACCLSVDEWRRRFDHWIEQGSPEDLLRSAIFFDLRPLAGRLELGLGLQRHIAQRAQAMPRFLKMLAADALRRQPPLNWLGGMQTHASGESQVLDLKLHGTAVFVDAARLLCLAQGIAETNTRRRFEAAAARHGGNARQAQTWSAAFEYLQMLRLQVQLDPSARPGVLDGHPNEVAPALLNDIDRRLLKESLRMAQLLQQELRLDYGL
jgi:CBS domain-containing protein